VSGFGVLLCRESLFQVQPAEMDELLKLRAEFPILERSTYLISNSLGAMPRGVYDSLHSYAASWAERGIRAWANRL